MRILITGATGYIGQHVAMAAAERGWEVHALVRAGSATARLVAAVPSIHLHTAEPTAASLQTAVAVAAPDVACHMAADSRAQVPAAEMADLLAANVTYGTLLVQALLTAGCTRLVNTGTWQEYGEDGEYAPGTLHAASKRALQDVLAHYARRRAMAIITLVPFDVYGPGDWRNGPIAGLVSATCRGDGAAVADDRYLDGRRMDLVHVADVAQAFLAAAERTAAAKAAGHHRVFALPSGRHSSLDDVAGLLGTLSGRPVPVPHGHAPHPSRPATEPTECLPTLPGWRASRSLEQGLAELIADCDRRASSGDFGEDPANKQSSNRDATNNGGIFYFITWHSDVSSLIRILYSAYDERNHYYISVGGNQKKEDVLIDWILQAPNITVFHGPAVTWGGPRLLFENLLAAMRMFLDRQPQCQWFQVICNQSFPLLSQERMRAKLADPAWMEDHIRPPAWKPEFLAEADGHTMMQQTLHKVFSEFTTDPLLAPPTFLPTEPASCNFNFTDTARPPAGTIQRAGQTYMIMPHAADMRGLAFNKYLEFIDVGEEDRTYVRLLPPHIARWVHSVFRRYPLHSGDPFMTASRSFARFVLEDERALELQAAMHHQFGPEMNYFDTVKHNFPRDERGRMSHSVCTGKAGTLVVTDDDIRSAEQAVEDYRRAFFIRKVTRPDGVGLARHFGGLIDDERPESERRWSLAVAREPGPANRRIETFAAFAGGAWRLRNMTGEVLGELRPQADGTLRNGTGADAGRWWDEDGAIHVTLALEGGRTERYRRASASGGRLILVPDDVVGIHNGWGRFLDQPLETGFSAGPAQAVTVELACRDGALAGAEALLREGKSALGLVLDAHNNVADDPMLMVTRHRGIRWHGLTTGPTGRILAWVTSGPDSGTSGNAPQPLELCRVSVSPERDVLVFRRPEMAPEMAPEMDALPPEGGRATVALDAAALNGRRWAVTSRLRPVPRPIRFHADRRVEVEGDGTVGCWRLDGRRLLLADVADWRLGELTQFILDDGRWRMAGYGQYDLAVDDCLHIVEQ